MKKFLYRVACGVIIGIGCVLPGVSGGIMAISMNLYEPMVAAVSTFFRAVKRNIRFLLPIAIGGGIGILLTSNVLKLLIERHEGILLALFAGLVMGSLPGLLVEARGPEKQKFRVRHGVAAFCGLAFVLLFALGELSVAHNEKVAQLTAFTALAAGGVLAFGMILPGISSSFILIFLGLYGGVLNALAGILDLRTLFSEGLDAALRELFGQIVPLSLMTLSFAVCALLLIFGVNRALKRHHTLSYYAIIGFVAGSVVLIFPGIIAGFSWLSPILFLLGCGVTIGQFLLKERAKKRALQAQVPAGESRAPV